MYNSEQDFEDMLAEVQSTFAESITYISATATGFTTSTGKPTNSTTSATISAVRGRHRIVPTGPAGVNVEEVWYTIIAADLAAQSIANLKPGDTITDPAGIVRKVDLFERSVNEKAFEVRTIRELRS